MVQWSTNPVKKYFKLFTLYVRQAASTVLSKRQTIAVPGCYESQIQTVRRTYFPEEEQLDFEQHAVSPLIIGRLTLYFGVLPAIGITLLRYFTEGWSALIWLMVIPLVYFLSVFYHRKWKYEISEQGLRTKKGIFGEEASLLKWYKVQGVSFRQTIYQRRKNLADIYFYTAGGSIRIPYIELEKASAMMDFVLYKVESDERKWM